MAIVAALSTLCSCIYEYPDENTGVVANCSLRVNYDWSEAPEANAEGMASLFFPQTHGTPWRFDLPTNGGWVRMPQDSYDIITYNHDTHNILTLNGDDYDELFFCTRPTELTEGVGTLYLGPQPPRSRDEEQPVLAQPNKMWVSALPSQFITPQTAEMVFKPRAVTAKFTIIVEDITNLGGAYQMSMALSGLASGFVPSTMLPREEPVVMPGSLGRSGATSVSGQLLCWGDCAATASNTAYIYFWLSDGKKLSYEFDVSEQVESAPDPMNVTIRLGPIELPENTGGSSSGGLDVGVDSWNVIDIELST